MIDSTIVLFDLSGVLVELGGMPDFVEWTGKSAEDVGELWLKSHATRALESGHIDFKTYHQAFVEEWGVAISHDDLVQAFESWVKKPFPGAMEILAELSARHTLACLTNTNIVQWPVIRETIKADDYFEFQFVSHLMGYVKPDNNTYEHVIASLGLPAEKIVFLDDSELNVVAAELAGMTAHRVIGVEEVRSVLMQQGLL